MLTTRWACGHIMSKEGMSPQREGKERAAQWSIKIDPAKIERSDPYM